MAQVFMDNYHLGDKVYHVSGDSDSLDNLSLEPPVDVTTSDDEWRFIPGMGNIYQASIHGEIRSVDRVNTFMHYGSVASRIQKGRVLSQQISKDGYLHCMISIDGIAMLKSVHRLVALAFIPNPDNKPDVNHIDGNKTNNEVTNLEWVTKSENMQHAKQHDLWDPVAVGEIVRKVRGRPVICITDNNRRFDSMNAAAAYYHMDRESVKEAIEKNRPRKCHMFKYANTDEVQ